MPESPEVDALAGFIRSRATGRRTRSAELEEFRALKTRERSLAELEGRVVSGVRRFGKHIALDTDGPSLLISFGRAGWATWTDGARPDRASDVESTAPTIARIGFDDAGMLGLTDAGAWLSLGLWVVDDVAEHPSVGKLGVDPVADVFTRETLDTIVRGRRKQLKALLQEQESFAGIGNAYSDEILHAARLSPTTHAASLDDAERDRLYSALSGVLDTAFTARRGVSIDRQKSSKVASMAIHGRTGEQCPVCGGTVLDVPGSKGAAQYCPTCQTSGHPLS